MAPLRMTRFGIVLSKGAATTLGALTLAAGGMAFAGVANAAPPFIGTYTAVQKSFMIDPQTGAQLAQPDQVRTWIATSYCSLPGCTTHIVSNSLTPSTWCSTESSGIVWQCPRRPETVAATRCPRAAPSRSFSLGPTAPFPEP